MFREMPTSSRKRTGRRPAPVIFPGASSRRLLLAGLLGVALAAAPALGAPADQGADFTEFSLEDLLNIEIVSVSKRPVAASDAAAAVFVITAEDIRRSGATAIPDLLRMVPGIQVGRIDAHKWAVSARGLNARYANKLQVLIDGRSVYSPLFSGVYWDAQGVLLEDIERIEVIRGPGATLWGANAVNGVINIITKSAEQTRGLMMVAGAGTEERGFGHLRYGASLSDQADYRVSLGYSDHDRSVTVTGDDVHDWWDDYHVGARLDWRPGSHDHLTAYGEILRSNLATSYFLPSLEAPYLGVLQDETEVSGQNAHLRWSRTLSPTSSFTAGVYYLNEDRRDPTLHDHRQTLDLDLQHAFAAGSRHRLIWGLGYRRTEDDLRGDFPISLTPSSRQDDLLHAFVQDEITLARDRLRLTVGSKFERNDYTGAEIQPNARLLWRPAERHTIWWAVSRAVRTPSRINSDVHLAMAVVGPGTPGNPGPWPLVMVLEGNPDFRSEVLLAFESGYRVRLADPLSLDLAGYVHDYDDLRGTEAGGLVIVPDGAPPHAYLPLRYTNIAGGRSGGMELAADWRPAADLRCRLAYTWFATDADLAPDEGTSTLQYVSTPAHQVSLRPSVNLGDRLELDLWLRYVDALEDLGVEAYANLDLRVGWRPAGPFELSIVGQNLLHAEVQEFISNDSGSSFQATVQRGFYGKATWWF